MRATTLLCAICATLLLPATASAGGWTQPAGSGYAKVWGSYLGGAAAYDAAGDPVATETFRLARLRSYAEWGLREDLTIVGAVEPLGSATVGDRSTTFFGPAMVGLRQRFVDDGFQFAVEARGGGQLGEAPNLAPAGAAYEFRPTVQSGRFEWELQVGVPLGFGWFTAAAGPRWYSSASLRDELFATAQLGFGPFAGVVFDLHLAANTTLGPLETANVTGAGNTEYVGGGVGVSYWPASSVGFHVGADGAAFARANLGVAPLQAGVEFRF